MKFSGHETFPVREGWLHKGLKLVSENPSLFLDPEVSDYLGVGRNMAKSIKHWLQATGLAQAVGDHPDSNSTLLHMTKLGELIWDREQLENGLRHLPAVFRPWNEISEDERPDQRYWWLQLHRLIASKAEIAKRDEQRVMTGLERLADGDYDVEWRACAITFWTDQGSPEITQTHAWPCDVEGSELNIIGLSAGTEFVRSLCDHGSRAELPWDGGFVSFQASGQRNSDEDDVDDKRHVVAFTDLTVLIGKNNAGKSSVIEALRITSIAIQAFLTARRFDLAPQWALHGEELALFIREQGFVAEVSNFGHGLQMWLQIVWFLTRIETENIVVLDEPDVYMHPSLQEKLVALVGGKFSQCIISTHSPSIIAAVSNRSIVEVDRSKDRSECGIQS